jgi:hypothetical protein
VKWDEEWRKAVDRASVAIFLFGAAVLFVCALVIAAIRHAGQP